MMDSQTINQNKSIPHKLAIEGAEGDRKKKKKARKDQKRREKR